MAKIACFHLSDTIFTNIKLLPYVFIKLDLGLRLQQIIIPRSRLCMNQPHAIIIVVWKTAGFQNCWQLSLQLNFLAAPDNCFIRWSQSLILIKSNQRNQNFFTQIS